MHIHTNTSTSHYILKSNYHQSIFSSNYYCGYYYFIFSLKKKFWYCLIRCWMAVFINMRKKKTLNWRCFSNNLISLPGIEYYDLFKLLNKWNIIVLCLMWFVFYFISFLDCVCVLVSVCLSVSTPLTIALNSNVVYLFVFFLERKKYLPCQTLRASRKIRRNGRIYERCC